MTAKGPKVPDEPCRCGKQMLMSWWHAVTDAGIEGTDYVKHTRESCLTRTERSGSTIRPHPARALLEEARVMLEGVTSGPWVWDAEMCEVVSEAATAWDPIVQSDSGCYGPHGADGPFIAAARTLIPRLIEALEKELAR